MDRLFEKLQKSDVGCHMGNQYTGGIGYARSGLKICEQYADDYCVKFNSAKNVCHVFRGRSYKLDKRT